MNLDWIKNLPPQLMQFIEQLLPLPGVVQKYKEHVRRLEMEVIVLGNILIEKGVLTEKEIQQMTGKIMMEKQKQYTEDDKIERKITKKEQLNNVKKIQEIVDYRSEFNKKIEEENKIVKNSARLAPKGHGIK